jgi:hypothetical protein
MYFDSVFRFRSLYLTHAGNKTDHGTPRLRTRSSAFSASSLSTFRTVAAQNCDA